MPLVATEDCFNVTFSLRKAWISWGSFIIHSCMLSFIHSFIHQSVVRWSCLFLVRGSSWLVSMIDWLAGMICWFCLFHMCGPSCLFVICVVRLAYLSCAWCVLLICHVRGPSCLFVICVVSIAYLSCAWCVLLICHMRGPYWLSWGSFIISLFIHAFIHSFIIQSVLVPPSAFLSFI